MKKSWKCHGEDNNGSPVIAEARTCSPYAVTANAINKSAASPPQNERPAIRKTSQRSKKQRNLRRIQRQVPDARSLRHPLSHQRCLCIHVVQICATMSSRERAQSVEMQKVGSLEISVAVPKTRSGYVPRVEQPQAQGKDCPVSAEAPGGEQHGGSGEISHRSP